MFCERENEKKNKIDERVWNSCLELLDKGYIIFFFGLVLVSSSSSSSTFGSKNEKTVFLKKISIKRSIFEFTY